jgi:hypothetical protein
MVWSPRKAVFLEFSYKTEHILTIQPSNYAPWYLLKEVENWYPHKNWQMDVYGNFIHNCPKLSTTKMSFSGWMDKQWYNLIVEYYLAPKSNKLSGQAIKNRDNSNAKLKKPIWRYFLLHGSNSKTFFFFKKYVILRLHFA